MAPATAKATLQPTVLQGKGNKALRLSQSPGWELVVWDGDTRAWDRSLSPELAGLVGGQCQGKDLEGLEREDLSWNVGWRSM